MSRTGLDAETLARSLRARAGDGSIEWDCEPIQTSVLLDVADMLDENAKLRELVKSMYYDLTHMTFPPNWVTDYEADMRELGVGVDE